VKNVRGGRIAPGDKPGKKLTLPIKGIEAYCCFYEIFIGPILNEYRNKELSKDKFDTAIATVCTDKETYQFFHVVDVWDKGEPIDRRLFRSYSTLKKLLNEAKRYGWALLYRGLFAIPGKVFREYKEWYRECEETWEKAKRGETYVDPKSKEEKRWKGLRLSIFKLDKLTQLAPYILVDIDGGTFEDLKRLVSYLHKLGIYPEVWESASGEGNYHIYIHLVGMVKRWKSKDENGEEIEHREYYLPYASDYRVQLVIEAIKELLRHLRIPYDSVSATRAVWMEGIPNPEKGGKSSKKIWDGQSHRLDKLMEKLRPFWEKKLKQEAKKEYFSFLRKTFPTTGKVEICEVDRSNPIDYLQANISTAFRMLDRGYTWTQIESELKAGWGGDGKAFDRAFSRFKNFVEDVYRPLPKKRKKAKSAGKRKHKHYWEHIPQIKEVLEKDGLDSSLNHIHRRTGISKGTLSYIFRIVSREQILKDPEEAQALLKQYAKGGDRMTEAQKKEAQKRGKERWESYLDRFLEEALKRRKKSLGDEGKEHLLRRSEWFSTIRGVQIGHESITLLRKEQISKGEDGLKEPQGIQLESLGGKKISPDNGAESTVSEHGLRKEEDVSKKPKKSRLKKRKKGKKKSRYDSYDPIEKLIIRKALELINKVEGRWFGLGEVPRGNYWRLIFGAVRSTERRTYNLSGWGRFAFALGEILEELGHEVIYPRMKEETEEETFEEQTELEVDDGYGNYPEFPDMDDDDILLDF